MDFLYDKMSKALAESLSLSLRRYYKLPFGTTDEDLFLLLLKRSKEHKKEHVDHNAGYN